MNYAVYDIASGEIVTVQEKDVLAEGQGSLSLEIFPIEYVYLHYVVGDELELRPVSSVTISDGVISFINTHPVAAATIRNSEGDALEISPQDIALTDPGLYYVMVVQPFPYYTISEVFEHA
ncbi:hypothetical protein [Loktanella salsilacus]|uniref:hypothetical protein n=1 Tax=Loktanella salsilacus TaxID=195913 RepID=UPI003704CF12